MGAELLRSGLAGATEAAVLPLLQHVLMREPEVILPLAPCLLLLNRSRLLFLVKAGLSIKREMNLLH